MGPIWVYTFPITHHWINPYSMKVKFLPNGKGFVGYDYENNKIIIRRAGKKILDIDADICVFEVSQDCNMIAIVDRENNFALYDLNTESMIESKKLDSFCSMFFTNNSDIIYIFESDL